jgi:hypothetical protein
MKIKKKQMLKQILVTVDDFISFALDRPPVITSTRTMDS